MKIGLAQINPKVGDFNGNKQKILLALDALKEAEIVVFPELALTGYPPEDLLFNRDFLQQSQQALREIARSVPRNQVVILGAPRRKARTSTIVHSLSMGERLSAVTERYFCRTMMFSTKCATSRLGLLVLF